MSRIHRRNPKHGRRPAERRASFLEKIRFTDNEDPYRESGADDDSDGICLDDSEDSPDEG